MGNIILSVKDRETTLISADTVTTGEIEETLCHFDFLEWEGGYAKIAIFYQDESNAVLRPLDENNECFIPGDILKTLDWLYVGVYGEIVEGEVITKRKPVKWALVEVSNGSFLPGSVPPPPPAEVYDIIVGMMQQQAIDAQTALTAQTASETARTGAETAETNAKTSETNAKTSEMESGKSETNAKTSETNAAGSETQALNNMLNGITTHNIDGNAHQAILTWLNQVESMARGKLNGVVFDSVVDMYIYCSASTTYLQIGQPMLIRDVDVPDYWWDGFQPQILEANFVNLIDYYNKSQVDAMIPVTIEQTDYDALVTAGTVIAGRIYYVVPDGTLG